MPTTCNRDASVDPCDPRVRPRPLSPPGRARGGPSLGRTEAARSSRGRLFALLSIVSLSAALGCGISEYFLTAGDSSDDVGTETSDDDPCFNGEREPWESDVDCGGPICEPCSTGATCKVDADCTSTICADGICSDNPCQLENPCPTVLAPCMISTCDPEQGCLLEPLPDGISCGGDGQNEMVDGTCYNGICTGDCGPCDHLSGPCRVGVCEPISGLCAALWVEDVPCDPPGDGPGFCSEGVCTPNDTKQLLFVAEFDDPDPGWVADELWEIGEATASACSENGIEDPEGDAGGGGGGGGGGLAGTVIGGCLPPGTFEKTCLTSPSINVEQASTLVLRYWEIVDLPPPLVRGTVDLFDGEAWIEIHEVEPDVPQWTSRSLDLGAIFAPEIQVRFCVEATEEIAGGYSGWSVDTVELVCTGCGAP